MDKQTIQLVKKIAERRRFRLNFGIILKQDQKERDDNGLFDENPMVVSRDLVLWSIDLKIRAKSVVVCLLMSAKIAFGCKEY